MIGDEIRAARQALGLSLRETARRAHVNAGYLSQIENGNRIPSAAVLRALGDVLVADLRLPVPVSVDPVRADPAALGLLAGVLVGQRRLEDAIGARPIRTAVDAQARAVSAMVALARGPLRPAVLDVAAQWAQFAGWLHTATGDYEGAHRWFDRAADWALENADANMLSTVLGMRGYVAWKRGDLPLMLALARAAGRDTGATPGQRALAAQQEARAHALLGDADATDRLLDTALVHAERIEPDNEPPWAYFFGTDFLHLQRGRAYRYLGRRERAAETLTAGLAGLPDDIRDAEWVQSYRHDLIAVED